jgi:hypothetical protein
VYFLNAYPAMLVLLAYYVAAPQLKIIIRLSIVSLFFFRPAADLCLLPIVASLSLGLA